MMLPKIHPAAFELLWLQSRGRRRRMLRRFCQPRRLALSALATLLAVAWLGNAAATIWLREAAEPATLRVLLTTGLVFYATWHLAKAAFFRPAGPFDWTPEQHDLLAAMPLSPRDLIAHQLASVTLTTVLKAGLFALLLLPDLRSLSLGIAGLVLAMLVLELLRLIVDIATWGMSRKAFLLYRVTVVAALVAAGASVIGDLIRGGAFARINPGEGVLNRFLKVIVQLDESVLHYVGLPFRPIVDVIVAERFTAALVGVAAGAAAVVAAIAGVVVLLYAKTAARVVDQEKREFEQLAASGLSIVPSAAETDEGARPSRVSIPYLRGAGPLLWRQLLGARRHWGSLLTAMIAPAVLACIPCFVIADPQMAFLSTTGALAFYTFLLLPTALRFDFRRDLDRLAVLKGLPISPAAVAVGQTPAPVLIATAFQFVVLGAAAFARGVAAQHVVTAMLVMTPLNMLVFALDNLIYLLYPYRLNQEGLEIFLRTMLTFTGKGLLFAVGIGMMTAWGFTAAAVTRTVSHWIGHAIDAHAVFAVGMIAGPALIATLTVLAVAHVYDRMSPIEDLPR